MLWSDQPNRLIGIVLIALAVCTLLTFIFTVVTSDVDAFERDKIDDLLVDIEDNKATAILALIFSILGDAVFGIAAVAGLYFLLRDRSRLYALFGLLFILAGSVAFLVGDAGNNTMINLASDFAEGGPEGFDAGDPAILRDARSVAILVSSAQILGGTAISLGVIAFGVIIGWAPLGAVNPPRWLGWLAVVTGVGGILGWLIVLTEAAFVFFIISGLGSLIWLAVLGGWLLTSAEETPSQEAVSA